MKEHSASFLLLLTSMIWGLSFVAQSVSSEILGPFTFNTLRYLIGAVTILPFAISSMKKEMDWKKTIKGCLICGALLSAASIMQQIGIAESGAGKGGFITSLYIVIVPCLSVVLRKKIQKKTWIAAFLAIIGMFLLCIKNGTGIAESDIYLIICSFLFSFYMIALDTVGKDIDGMLLSFFQFIIADILTLPGMIAEKPELGTILSSWLPLLYAGILGSGIAYTFQIVAQKYVKPQKAAFLLSLESVWAAIEGAVLISERMTGKETVGCILVFLAVMLSQLDFEFCSKA